MKTIVNLLLLLLCIEAFSQEKKEIIVKTEINEATVFISGAQVVRKKTLDINKGSSTLKFVELSPYLDPKSIQFKIDGNVIILSVNHQYNYIDSLTRSKELEDLFNKLKTIDEKLKMEEANLNIINEEFTFLKDNSKIGGKSQEVSLINLKETSTFYKEKMSALIYGGLEIKKKMENLKIEYYAVQKQIMEISGNQQSPISEVLVKIDAKKQSKCEIELSYFVNNAGWYPSYDIRANSIDKPIELVYKANIHQDTKEDWENVKLRLSSSNPNMSGNAPKLQTYYLNYYSTPPNYSKYNTNSSFPTFKEGNATVKGKIFDANTKEPIPFASVAIEKNGKLISGTAADFNGEYTINQVPPGIYDIKATEVTHETSLINNIYVNSDKITFQDFNLNGKSTTLSTVEVTSYKVPLIDKDQTVCGQTISYSEFNHSPTKNTNSSNITTGGNSNSKKNTSLPFTQTESQTAFEFEIKIPYTIPSDNKTNTVDIDEYEINAAFDYYCVPKIDKDAFLIAHIVDWEKYNLLEGEANIYFENTFVGKSILDVKLLTDTLSISLGRDKNVVVTREKIKEYTTKQFLGNKKEESKAWKISVKNNKKQSINMTLYDQVPVSTIAAIEVTVENNTAAIFNKTNGEIKWNFILEGSGKKDFELKYKVKYPKDRVLNIE